jgi:GAF domain-containing protein
VSLSPPIVGPAADESQRGQDLQALFHRLNNQLGIVLAQAELLEAKASDAVNRERAGQVVSSALAALGTVREIRQKTEP